MKQNKTFKIFCKSAKKINILFILLIFYSLFPPLLCNDCNPGKSLSDSTCFNGIIYINQLNYRSGHFASKKNNDLIIEYSGDPPVNSRLFYGVKNNGRGFFDDNYIRQKILTETNGRYESRNIFVSLQSDINKDKEYLFSTSSYQSLTELHDLENDSYKARYSDNFNGNRIFSFTYSLLGKTISNQNYYFLIFTSPSNKTNPDSEDGSLYVIKKFALTGFDLDNYDNSKSNLEITKFGDRVISGFIMDEESVIVILFLNNVDNNAQYTIRFYDYDLKKIGKDLVNWEDILIKDTNIVEHMGLYSNSIYLKDKIGLFIFFHKSKLNFQCFKFNKDNDNNYQKTDVFYVFFENRFDSDISLSDVHKINDNKVAFVTTSNNGINLYIILLDFYGSYSSYKFRIYNYTLFNDLRIKKELSVYSFKQDFLVFSSTMGPRNTDNGDPLTSFLIFFSYPNGTDFTINISPYIKNADNYDSTQNLFNYLMNTMKIENNIFGYKKVQKIKLVTIPEELLFYNENENTPINNEGFLYSNYILKQNTNKKKTDELYHLYYQFIAKEPSYSELYNSDIEIINSADYSSSYTSKEVYGRTNKLSFKLCHDYCETCYFFGGTNDAQNCTTCLSEYTYDYLTYINKYTGNCVPKDQMYDIEEHKLKLCASTEYKYYYNASRNGERYCFKYDYECPDAYNYFNTTSHECLNYIPPIPFTTPIIPTTIIKIPSTAPIIQKTIPIIPIPTTVPIIQTTINKVPSTIQIIPTTIPNVPTTIIKIPTTILNLPTTILNNPTTIPIIPTTILKIQTTIITTIPNIIKTTIIYNCNYYTIKTDCIFTNLTDREIYSKLKKDIISTYPINGSSVVVNGLNEYSFQLTNTFNENNNINSETDVSAINLGECENTLRDIYHLDDEESITILKYFKLEGLSNEKNILYELYHPTTHEKLNLSYCENYTYELYIPLNLSEEFKNLYEKAKNQGYDLFDSEDEFYNKICTPYTSGNGTDVILDDRMSIYYSKVINNTSCPENCVYISYSTETDYLKCECGVNNAEISTFDINNIITSNSYKSFYSTLQYSNYKVMICYNLVFNFKVFLHNSGSVLILILFILFIIFMIFYTFKGVSPLKISISKIVFEKFDKIPNVLQKYNPNNTFSQKKSNKSKSKDKLIVKNQIIRTAKNPPKKNDKNSLKNELVNQKKSKSISISTINNIKNELNKKSILKRKTAKNENNLAVFAFNTRMKEKKEKSVKLKVNENQTEKKLLGIKSNNNLIINDKKQENDSLKFEDLDNFELNNLDYIPACEVDERSFCRTYWSVLMREQSALLTFFACTDYNLFYIKLDKFIIQFCTNMAMNGLFFSDESMHNIYVNNGENDFIQQIPQMVYSLIIDHVLEVILCFLSLTDTSIYEIKELSKNKENAEKIIQIMNCLRIKLIVFFIFSFILLLFCWYFISAFCAVYQNTQIIFVKDSMMSFFTSMIDPFIIYAGTTLLRNISLAKCFNKKLSWLYSIAQFLPLF